MSRRRFDVLVVGAGPAGSIAALVLARAGASVALLDRAQFPRDKACGDFIGPRGLQVLTDLGIPEPPGLDVGDMVVVGPTGRRVILPCFNGVTYPGRARAMTRSVFDNALRTAALDAGAIAFAGRANRPLLSGGDIDGFTVSDGDGEELRADFVIGADGATSHVALSAGLVEGSRVLWGFAVRCYV
ncbi:MAG TPA: FAD-dependent monooxygenase, partial [Acidimicrobiales bacterium]|nr:FAD-dependent monooxygenase [Acidimicrobiales bacterium]